MTGRSILGIDTSNINQIILNDEIDKYFEKLK